MVQYRAGEKRMEKLEPAVWTLIAVSVLLLLLAVWGTAIVLRRLLRRQPVGRLAWVVGVFWVLVATGAVSDRHEALDRAAPSRQASASPETTKAAIKKAMEVAVAARHGGVLPKTMSDEDLKVATAAGVRATEQQSKASAAEKLKAMKTRPDPKDVTYSPAVVEMAVKQQLRDPDSAVFGSMNIYSDRKLNGYYTPAVCGSVNSKNGFGGYAGEKAFVFIVPLTAVMIEGSTDRKQAELFVKTYNELCAGKHN